MATGKNLFKEARFHDEEAAREWFEASRWPDGPVCPNCGSLKHYATKKAGRYRCGEKECRKDFTVMTKSVMERSHAKLTQWAMAFHLYAASKKGFTAMQLQRHLGCEYNTAWFLHHRVMEAMRRGGLDVPQMGGEGKIVEVDETYFGEIPEANQKVSPQRQGRPYKKRRHVGGSVPPNLLAVANTESTSRYQEYCRDNNIPIHPARFPAQVPEYFIRMLTEPGDLVVDPFAGSCVTGSVAEALRRKWICCELSEEYLQGALSRFKPHVLPLPKDRAVRYEIPVPCSVPVDEDQVRLHMDGGRKRPAEFRRPDVPEAAPPRRLALSA